MVPSFSLRRLEPRALSAFYSFSVAACSLAPVISEMSLFLDAGCEAACSGLASSAAVVVTISLSGAPASAGFSSAAASLPPASVLTPAFSAAGSTSFWASGWSGLEQSSADFSGASACSYSGLAALTSSSAFVFLLSWSVAAEDLVALAMDLVSILEAGMALTILSAAYSVAICSWFCISVVYCKVV